MLNQPAKKKTILIVALLALALLAVIAFVMREQVREAVEALDEPTEVVVRVSTASPVARGPVRPAEQPVERTAAVTGPADGVIKAWQVEAGQQVEQGDVLGQLDPGALRAQHGQVQARMGVLRHQLRSTRHLVEGGYEPRSNLDAAQERFDQAQVELNTLEEQLSRTRIIAPVAGTVREMLVDAGNTIAAGQEVLSLTYNVEDLPAGSPLAEKPVPAHQVPRNLIRRDADGRAGLMTVDAEDKVQFHAIELIKEDATNAWVAGMPREARIIVVGQGSVEVGEEVRVVVEAN